MVVEIHYIALIAAGITTVIAVGVLLILRRREHVE